MKFISLSLSSLLLHLFFFLFLPHTLPKPHSAKAMSGCLLSFQQLIKIHLNPLENKSNASNVQGTFRRKVVNGFCLFEEAETKPRKRRRRRRRKRPWTKKNTATILLLFTKGWSNHARRKRWILLHSSISLIYFLLSIVSTQTANKEM